MVVAKLSSGTLKVIVDAVSDMVETAVVDFNSEGIRVQAMDSSHVSLCFLDLKSTGFAEYSCGENYNVGVSMNSMSKVLRSSGTEDVATIELEDRDNMCLRFENTSRKSEFQLKLMEIDSEYLSIPEMDADCTVNMSSSQFQKTVRDVSLVGDSCGIEVSEAGMTFTSSGEVGSAKFEVSPDDSSSFEGACSGNFSVRYLQLFTKASALSKTVRLTMTAGAPMCVEYVIGELGNIRYYLAPKIDDEMDD